MDPTLQMLSGIESTPKSARCDVNFRQPAGEPSSMGRRRNNALILVINAETIFQHVKDTAGTQDVSHLFNESRIVADLERIWR